MLDQVPTLVQHDDQRLDQREYDILRKILLHTVERVQCSETCLDGAGDLGLQGDTGIDTDTKILDSTDQQR